MSIAEEKREGFYLNKDDEWIPEGWAVKSLLELTSKIGSGATPRGGKDAYKTEGVTFIRSQNILDLKFEPKGLAFIDQDQANRLSNVEIQEEDVLINITGDSVARVCKVPSEYLPARVNQHVAIIRANRDESDPQFLEYLLVTKANKGDLLGMASAGATRNALTKGMFENFERSVPSVLEQKAIAAVLASLDAKIVLLREQNETLEDLSQTLFKRWFFDFNFPDENGMPYKDSGRKMIPSELGEIPEGWKVSSVADHVASISQTFPLREYDQVIFLNTGDIQNGRFLHTDYSPTKRLPGQAKKSIQKGDILFSEIRPENHRHAYVFFDAPYHVVSTKLMVLRKKGELESIFTYFFMRLKTSIDHLQMMAESRSGTFPQITYTTLESLLIALPADLSTSNLFTHSVLRPFSNKRQENNQQIETLTQLRDTLLPKLMKGEIRVPVES